MEMKSPVTCSYSVTVRRNPHRKARPTPATNAPPIPNPPSSFGDIPSFPIDDILSIEIPQEPQPNQSQSSTETTISENLQVFLRIRPLKPLQSSGKVADLKPRTKNAWPQNPPRKNAIKEKKSNKKSDICVVVNDSRSITLFPPLALQDTKKMKSEVYEGFSHVFSVDSSQGEVYERMVNPLVEDFLKGKSGMLAALGPSGSGKTHTVFGCPREPGMLPLILRKIFKQTEGSHSEPPRKFYISMFEINSERGKGERISDLFPDGGNIFMQQSTIKGLQESIISDVTEAESLIARGMLRRATAMTNTNSQSSRSQCIINIRCAPKMFDEEVDAQSESAVLTIVDLAGAEREKRTGNQGARLLESNFINNTSMVFGLCLRSLLEHQKNPKKQLQKHFQNSLLTRYLRDYLEGKKRMTLILTVKSGEEDYLDTSSLLRQASPYMKIKFNVVEKPFTSRCNKRQFPTFPRSEQHKRVKVNGVDGCETEEGKSAGTDHQLSVEEVTTEKLKKVKPVRVLLQYPEILKTNTTYIAPSSSDNNLENMERNNQIMQNFAKAVWSVLKEYKNKLEVAESEVYSLRIENARYSELEKELSDLKSRCSCSKGISVGSASDEMDTKSEHRVNISPVEEHSFGYLHENYVDTHSLSHDASELIGSLRKCDSSIGNDQHIHLQRESSDVIDPSNKVLKLHNDQDVLEAPSPHSMGSDSGESEKESDSTVWSPDVGKDSCPCVEDYDQLCNQENGENATERSPSVDNASCNCLDNFKQQIQYTNQKHEGFPANLENIDELKTLGIEDNCSDEEETGSRLSEVVVVSSFQSITEVNDDSSSVGVDQQNTELDEYTNQKHESFSTNLENFDELKASGIEDNCSDEEETGSRLSEAAVVSYFQSIIEVNDDCPSSVSVGVYQQNTELDEYTNQKHESFPANLENVDELKTLGIEDNCSDEEETGSRLSEAVVVSSSQSIIEVNDDCPSSVSVRVDQQNTELDEYTNQKHESFPANLENVNELKTLGIEDNCSNEEETGSRLSEAAVVSSFQSITEVNDDSPSSVGVDQQNTELDEKLLDPRLSSKKGESFTKEFNDRFVQESKQKLDTSCQPKDGEKPKRKLLPASSILLRDISSLDFKDENERPKGNRGEKKLAADERYRTQGSISLVRLLKNNLHL